MLMRTALGLMSGTSLDGVDVAIIVTNGDAIGAFGPTHFRAYSGEERAVLRAALAAGPAITNRLDRSGVLAEAERVVTVAHAEAVEQMLELTGIGRSEIDVVGFHGQTVFHAPDRRLTVQIGDGQALANRLGLPVVHDFRVNDVARGGQGAPLVPVYHAALTSRADLPVPVAVLNVGGVANVTVIGSGGVLDMVAFDTGPGNALLDDWCLAHTGRAFDEGGGLAASGTVDEAVLNALLDHPYFDELPPKSLDRNAFSADRLRGLSAADGAATLTAFTAAAVGYGLDLVPEHPTTIIVCGGGAKNPTLLDMLRVQTGARVVTAETFDWSSDFLEAQAFAYLAVRHLRELPLTYPSTTGVPAATLGGVLVKPEG